MIETRASCHLGGCTMRSQTLIGPRGLGLRTSELAIFSLPLTTATQQQCTTESEDHFGFNARACPARPGRRCRCSLFPVSARIESTCSGQVFRLRFCSRLLMTLVFDKVLIRTKAKRISKEADKHRAAIRVLSYKTTTSL